MDLLFTLHVTAFDELAEIRVLGTEKGLDSQIEATEEFLKNLQAARRIVLAVGEGDGNGTQE